VFRCLHGEFKRPGLEGKILLVEKLIQDFRFLVHRILERQPVESRGGVV
jgi:hypothetical protein